MGGTFLEVLVADDISVGGVGVRVPHGFSIGELENSVELIILLPGHRPFKAEGMIRHRTGTSDQSKFGVEFTRVGNPKAIQSYVLSMLSLGRQAH